MISLQKVMYTKQQGVFHRILWDKASKEVNGGIIALQLIPRILALSNSISTKKAVKQDFSSSRIRDSRISIVDGAHRRVHEPTWNRNVFGIKALWLGDLFNADPLDFIVGVEAEVDGLHLLWCCLLTK